ncbi:hypothetical protein AOLI_G00115310 [Acnodon oligacanthus]
MREEPSVLRVGEKRSSSGQLLLKIGNGCVNKALSAVIFTFTGASVLWQRLTESLPVVEQPPGECILTRSKADLALCLTATLDNCIHHLFFSLYTIIHRKADIQT